MRIHQFDIWTINLNPSKGSEQREIRPCVILQTNAVNHISRTLIIAPLTSKKLEKIFPFEVKILKDKLNKLDQDSKIKIEQTRVISTERLVSKIGSLEEKYHDKIFTAIKIIFDFNKDFI